MHSHPYFLLMAFTLLHSNGLRVYLMYDYILYGLDTGGTEYLFIKHMNNKPRMMSLRKKLFRKSDEEILCQIGGYCWSRTEGVEVKVRGQCVEQASIPLQNLPWFSHHMKPQQTDPTVIYDHYCLLTLYKYFSYYITYQTINEMGIWILKTFSLLLKFKRKETDNIQINRWAYKT